MPAPRRAPPPPAPWRAPRSRVPGPVLPAPRGTQGQALLLSPAPRARRRGRRRRAHGMRRALQLATALVGASCRAWRRYGTRARTSGADAAARRRVPGRRGPSSEAACTAPGPAGCVAPRRRRRESARHPRTTKDIRACPRLPCPTISRGAGERPSRAPRVPRAPRHGCKSGAPAGAAAAARSALTHRAHGGAYDDVA